MPPNSNADRIHAYRDIKNVDTDTTHVLLSTDTLLRCPLEGSNARILDFVQVLYTLSDINEHVRASRLGTETPDLSCIGDIPAVLVSEDTGTDFVIITRVDLAALNSKRELLLDGHSLAVETVVLVLRLGKRNNRGLGLDSLTVRDDGVRNLEGNTSVVLLEILYTLAISLRYKTHEINITNLETDFQVEFTSTGNDVLSVF